MDTIIKGLLAACLLFVASCQKKDTTPVDLSKVSVTFANPEQGHIYHKGDTMQMAANVSYVSEINGVGMQIIDTATGSILYQDDHDLHTDHYSLTGSWADTVSRSTTLEVKVFVFVANNTTPAERSTYFVTQP